MQSLGLVIASVQLFEPDAEFIFVFTRQVADNQRPLELGQPAGTSVGVFGATKS